MADIENTAANRLLLYKTALALLVGAVLVSVCYYFVDRPVATFIHQHQICNQRLLDVPPLLSDWLKACAAPMIIVVVVWRLWKPGGRLQLVLLALAANVIATAAVKQSLKWCFGRYWPETWKYDNPSWIRDGVYGFHPFHDGPAYEAFPSGHAAVICCVLSVLWFAYPRGRWLYAASGALVCAALIGMNYHFVGDVIAGVLLGCITGVYTAQLFALDDSASAS